MKKNRSVSHLGIVTYTLGAILLMFVAPSISLSPGTTNQTPNILLLSSFLFLFLATIMLIWGIATKHGT